MAMDQQEPLETVKLSPYVVSILSEAGLPEYIKNHMTQMATHIEYAFNNLNASWTVPL